MNLWREQTGQGLSEYAMLLGGVVLMVTAAMVLWDGSITQLWTSIGSFLAGNSP